MTIYIIKWAIALTALYSLYGLFLRKETFHALNRGVLLAILGLSMVLPLCHLTANNSFSDAMQEIEQAVSGESHALSPLPANSEQGVAGSVQGEVQSRPAPSLWFVALVGIYLAGMLYRWVRYAIGYVSLCRLIRGGERIKRDDIPSHVHLIVNAKATMPCSWMRWILISPADLCDNGDMILRHEMAHVGKRHSWDMLLCDVTVNMLWFLPFAYLLRTDLRDVHEYQADHAVMEGEASGESYQHMLIVKASKVSHAPIVNNLNASEVKKRLAMMFRKESSRLARMKVLYILPLLAIVLMGFARPDIIEQTEQALAQEEEKVKGLVEDVIAPSKEPSAKQGALVADLPATTESGQEMTDTIAAEPSATRQMSISDAVTSVPSVPLAEDGLPILTDLPLNTNPNIIYSGAWVDRYDNESILHLVYTFEKDDEQIFIASNDTYIIDRATEVRYKCRGTLIPHTFDHDFHVRGMRGKTVDFALVFPPLPRPEHDRWFYAICIGLPKWRNSSSVDLVEDRDSRKAKDADSASQESVTDKTQE
ncbi:MAG: M56 family metallopeptidase [Bacteroidales bacterium]|nr:M56 family metallopeptidase [Bacteroidales bacterium]